MEYSKVQVVRQIAHVFETGCEKLATTELRSVARLLMCLGTAEASREDLLCAIFDRVWDMAECQITTPDLERYYGTRLEVCGECGSHKEKED